MLKMFIGVLSCLIFFIAPNKNASASDLKEHKDSLFAYSKVLTSENNGAYRVIDYQELRDINERDQIPERRVNGQFVDYAGKRATKSAKINTPAGALSYYLVGTTKNASIITVYIHGKGGNGKQGIDDFSFGGNFNRIKMLMLRNKGLYLSPDAGDFGANNVQQIAALIASHLAQAPSAKLVVACGSGGGTVCYELAKIASVASKLNGIILLGSFWNDDYISSSAGKARVPVFIGHGSRDPIFAIDKVKGFYDRLRSAGIPAQMVRFETGSHGTPIRMTDWREAINWMLEKQ